jgi:hypothetical protein
MNITVRFGNPIAAAVYTGVVLMIGWAIGSHWGYTINAVLMLVTATIVLVLHDAVLALMVMLAAAKILRARTK